MSFYEESIVNGIIESNISYFILNFKEYKNTDIFINYFNDYINGDLVDANEVYKTILNKIIKKNKNDIFVEICDYCLKEEEYIYFIENFSNYLQSQDIIYNYKYNLVTLFLNRPRLNLLLSKIDLTNCLNMIINKDIITKPKSSNYNTFDIYLKLLKTKDTRCKIIDYFSEHIHKLKENKNIKSFIDLDLEKGYHLLYIFQVNLVLLLIDLWSNGINENKLQKISKKEINYLSITFYQLQNILEYTLIKIYQEKKTRITELQKVKELIELYKDNDYISYTMYKKLKTDLEVNINIIYTIIKNKNIILSLSKFYDNTILWLNNNYLEQSNQEQDLDLELEQECFNDILENMYIFYKNNKIELTQSVTELLENIYLGKITNNPNIKINYIYLFNNYLLEIVDYNSKTIAIHNFVNYDKNISKLTLCLLTLSNSFKKSFNNDQIYNNIYPMSLLTNVFNLTIYNVDDFRYYFSSKINLKYFKELIYENLSHFQYVVDEILELLNKINSVEQSNINLEVNLDELSEEDNDIVNESKEKINNYTIYLHIFSSFIIKTSKYYSNIILCDEIKHSLNNIIILIINNITIHQKKYKVINKSALKFTPIDLLITIKSILLNLIYIRKNESIVSLLISENDSYIKNSIKRLSNILSKKNQIKTIDYSYLHFLNDKINDKIDNNKEIEIPDDLCDPIMDTLIENPVMLPNNIIIDYGTISRHLLTNESNPFNREPLTLEILDEYNKKDSIKNEIDLFKTKVIEFKKTHNI